MITIAEIQRVTADHFGLLPDIMTRPGRHRAICRPRQIGMYLSSQLLGASLPSVGRKFSRHHTTVFHAVTTIQQLRRRNAYMAEHDTYLGDAVDAIIAKLEEKK